MIEILSVIIGIVISRFLGKHVLLVYYKLRKNEEAINWLKNPPEDYAEYFGGGVIINVVGLLVFTGIFFLIIKVGDYIIFNYY